MLRTWICGVLLAGVAVGSALAAYTDPFDGNKLEPRWTHRSPDGDDKFTVEKGWFTWSIQAGQDLFKQGVDKAPFLLTDPPANDTNFSIETKMNILMDDLKAQPPASHAGLIFFREDKWAYTLWGPYANTDIRVEDCIGADYRWRAEAQIGVNKAADGDVWLKITKTGGEFEFFYKDNEGDKWESGGKDTKIAKEMEKGTYKVGLFLKNWGGSVAMKTAFDYFDSPELGGLSVDPKSKVATSWADLKISR